MISYFLKLGVTEEDARIIADVLIAADLRGVNSPDDSPAHLLRHPLAAGQY